MAQLISMSQQVQVLDEEGRRVIANGRISGRAYMESPRYDVTTPEGIVYQNMPEDRVRIKPEPAGYIAANGFAMPMW